MEWSDVEPNLSPVQKAFIKKMDSIGLGETVRRGYLKELEKKQSSSPSTPESGSSEQSNQDT
jgi:hypothetical protein